MPLGGERDEGGWEVDLVVDRAFHRIMPTVYLVVAPPVNTWPHVEADGRLCLWPEGVLPGDLTATEIVADALGKAWTLLADSVSGSNASDFRDEFLSYWNRAASPRAPLVLSTVRPSGPCRRITVLTGLGKVLAAEGDSEAGRLAPELRRRGPQIQQSGRPRVVAGASLPVGISDFDCRPVDAPPCPRSRRVAPA